MPEIRERSGRPAGGRLTWPVTACCTSVMTGLARRPARSGLCNTTARVTRHSAVGARLTRHAGEDSGLTWLAELVGGEAIRSAPAASVSITTDTACGDTEWADGGEASAPHVTSAVAGGNRGPCQVGTTLTHQ